MDPKLVTPVLLGALVAWGIYRRLRRNIGRQPVNTRHLQIRTGIFVVIGALVLLFSLGDLSLLGALLGGFAGGAALGYLGIRHTKFETTTQGHFYTPHTYIGLFVSALLLGRIVYRFLAINASLDAAVHAPQNPFDSYHKSPLTLAIFGVLIGYYVLFNIGILWSSRSLTSSATPGP